MSLEKNELVGTMGKLKLSQTLTPELSQTLGSSHSDLRPVDPGGFAWLLQARRIQYAVYTCGTSFNSLSVPVRGFGGPVGGPLRGPVGGLSRW